jgi:Domain of unknown function (DUF4037)
VSQFVPGIELSRAFYDDVVAPLIEGVEHSAALLGTGSEVLGLDTARSTDHGWGPRLQVFVEAAQVAPVRAAVADGLPDDFRGWPTRFGWDDIPVTHHVLVLPLDEWLRQRLGFDPRAGVRIEDWLATPQQILLEVTRGAVYRDDTGELERARQTLAWYPDDVWLWLLACQWRRIDQEEPFVGRAAEVGDELGSRVVAGRLVRDLVRLCFLLERTYAPYSKWLGTAFQELDAFASVGAPLLETLEADAFPAREDALVRAVQGVAALHNARGVTRTVDASVGLFHDRPYRVLGSGRFVDACIERVGDERLRALPLVGGVDQLMDSVDVLSEPTRFMTARRLFDLWLGQG